MRSIKEECLNRVIPFGERHLHRAIAEFVAHYHGERNHQGLGNELIDGVPAVDGQSDSPSTAARRAPQLLLSARDEGDERFHGSARWWDITRGGPYTRGAIGRSVKCWVTRGCL